MEIPNLDELILELEMEIAEMGLVNRNPRSPRRGSEHGRSLQTPGR
jgi:hypothetical protein